MGYDHNKVTLIGACSGDAVFSEKEEKTPYIRFQMTTKEIKPAKSDDDDVKIIATPHRMIAFGDKAKKLSDYVENDALLLIEGRLQYERGREDSTKEFDEIIISDFHIIQDRQFDINQIRLCGRLGDDPTLRYNSRGIAFAHLSLCTNYGQRHDWHKVVLSHDQADFAKECLGKGDKIYVEGKISRSSWINKHTQKKQYRTEIIDVTTTQLVSRKNTYARTEAVRKDAMLDFDKAISV